MRNLVQPLPSTHCEHCDGELLFKCIERDDVQIFVCAKCGREHTRKLIHEPYTAHTAGWKYPVVVTPAAPPL